MKRIFALLLLLSMAVTLFASCGENASETTDGTSDESGQQAVTVPDYQITDLRVNYEKTPSCVDEKPVFSWVIESAVRGTAQTSYRIRVADSSEKLSSNDLVWDSGTVSSSDTLLIPCGSELKGAEKYFWDVTATLNNGETVKSDKSYFYTSLLELGFEGSEWIMQSSEDIGASGFSNAFWIWYLNGDEMGKIPEKTEYLRYTFDIKKDVESAYITFTADDCGELYVNEIRTGVKPDVVEGWMTATLYDVTDYVIKGKNLLACSVSNTSYGYAGLIVKMLINYTDGTNEVVVSSKKWLATDTKTDDWYKFSCDESVFNKVGKVIKYSNDPWGENVKVSTTVSSDSAPMVRGSFTAKSGVRSALLYASAAGLYEPYMNGSKIGVNVLDPGKSEYNQRIMYQCHDVTDLIKEGENAIGAILGRGWYIGAYSSYNGKAPAFICKLVIDYEDGTRQIFGSGEDWEFTLKGPIMYNDIFNGETYDATREIEGWSLPGASSAGWKKVSVTNERDLNIGALTPQVSGSVKVMEKVSAVEMTEPEPNRYIYNFGQNLAGVVSIKVKGEKGQTVTLRHAEMLNNGNRGSDGPAGTLYVENLRTAKATDKYTMKGAEGGEVYSPVFTYHGFQYVEIIGLSEPLPLEDVTALVLYSDMETTGNVTTSDELLNKLFSNTLWGQKSNFLSNPTDCPQRDERMGWTGDAQVFSGTASYNMNVKTFFDKFIDDMNDCQSPVGAYTDVAPGARRAFYDFYGNSGWADAGVIIPWVMYQKYGDISYIEKYYDNMRYYIKYLVNSASTDFVKGNSRYGDWLSIGEDTGKDLSDTAYCVYVCDIMAKFAEMLEKPDDVTLYSGYASQYREAWLKRFYSGEGYIINGTQTAYLLALAFDILPEEDRAKAAGFLNNNIVNNGNKLTTGFLGTPLLLPVLCEYGYYDTAFALLQQQDFPSWKYSILQGATTIWERWDSYTKASGFGMSGMNSFNHYSYGSVIEWVYSTLCGIKNDENAIAFKHFILAPVAGGGITSASGEYNSVNGLIRSGWEATADGAITKYNCKVPANTTATLTLDAQDASVITESGKPLSEAEGIISSKAENGKVIIELSGGEYSFEIKR